MPITKKEAKYAVVTYVDFYKENYAKFVKYFKTLDEANKFAFVKAKKVADGVVYFFGDKKLANKEAQYMIPEYIDDKVVKSPYKKQIISYNSGYEIFSVVKPYPGVENSWKDMRKPSLTYKPDSLFPSKTCYPIYGESLGLPKTINSKNTKTKLLLKVKVPKEFTLS